MAKKEKIVTPEEFNEWLLKLQYYNTPYHIEEYRGNKYINTSLGNIVSSCSGKIIKRPSATAIARVLTEHYREFFTEFQYGYKLVKQDKGNTKVKWDIDSYDQLISRVSYFDETLVGKELHNIYCYDINSSYPYAMLHDMPDTRVKARYNSIVGEHEIGFNKNGSVTDEVGVKCDYVFPLCESPFKSYVNKYYELKKNTTDSDLRQLYKDYLNLATGLIQRHCIFIRNAIIYYAVKHLNHYFELNQESECIYSNVDSLYFLRPAKNIPIGENIGEFKMSTIGTFIYLGVGMYQADEEVHYKGLNGALIKDIRNIKEREELKWKWCGDHFENKEENYEAWKKSYQSKYFGSTK